MVLALLEGRKTQTRRIFPNAETVSEVRRTEQGGWQFVFDSRPTGGYGSVKPPRAQVGGRLWVREAWCTHTAYDDLSPSEMGGEEAVQYSADGALHTRGWPTADFDPGRNRASMHMPRWASRLTLKVTEVRVQQIQDISEDDAAAEGWPAPADRAKEGIAEIRDAYPIGWFAHLWDSLNAARGFGWDTNPWVSATSFEVVKGNIDEVKS